MVTPSNFLINKIVFKIKIELAIEWGTHEPKCGVYKMATPLGSFRGSNLNLRWSKCGIRWVDRWLPISWLHIGSFWCMLGYCVVTLIWLIILIRALDVVFLYFIASLVWYIDMPIIIDCSSCFAWYSDSISSWLFCSLHMHRLTIVHRLTWCVVFSGSHIILIVFWAWCLYRHSSWSS